MAGLSHGCCCNNEDKALYNAPMPGPELTRHSPLYNPDWPEPDLFNKFIQRSKQILNAVINSGVKRLLVTRWSAQP
ncbi:hypothetical protein EHS86_01790 [Erwinia amylovora]|uniref:Uncharacterized protein n=4 Tax=Erwinia amylovora TaxID=552 RepID=A0A831A2F5_ERWAM|nr:hypothetical protein AD997_08550 [Erwinia amylovora]EKV54399.1 hypothetical protein EaACW_1703 [Erwinia amylovora ACW56400]CBA20647.1 hypothetical protein predicted by Glimmer/Critica [Erwinia amylovora CFBP1430]CBJ46348.1 hypothetical protein EAM_1673 [Erwinia amylovora ATCC 49946]CCO78550.1 hypothetical protein BN432_1752 [Erwinia amylovora Ea356]CCO82345.1 hypothetical protein BN433_1775 [Erwinia amylovora Ea266]CCO86131.1 hypothetical protein BN434_1743 [Erwinia amylovora CFBP 2585]CC